LNSQRVVPKQKRSIVEFEQMELLCGLYSQNYWRTNEAFLRITFSACWFHLLGIKRKHRSLQAINSSNRKESLAIKSWETATSEEKMKLV
jgi:hypothetical protein